MVDFAELFEKGDFVELGLEVEKKFKEIDKNYKIKPKDKYNAKHNSVIKNLYEKWNPIEKSEVFFNLSEWDLNKLSFVVAVDSVARGLKTSQIRKILNMSTTIHRKLKIKGADQGIANEITKLSYTLAYSLGRHKEIEPLARVLNKAISKLTDERDYGRIHNFLQAVVAYHKLLGGRD